MLTAMVFGIIRNQCIVATVQNTQWTNEWKELFSSGDKCSKWFQDDEMCLMLIFDFAAAQSIWFTNDKSWRCSSLCKTVFLGFNVWLFHLEQGHPRIKVCSVISFFCVWLFVCYFFALNIAAFIHYQWSNAFINVIALHCELWVALMIF